MPTSFNNFFTCSINKLLYLAVRTFIAVALAASFVYKFPNRLLPTNHPDNNTFICTGRLGTYQMLM